VEEIQRVFLSSLCSLLPVLYPKILKSLDPSRALLSLLVFHYRLSNSFDAYAPSPIPLKEIVAKA
jgi:hypothetical protein